MDQGPNIWGRDPKSYYTFYGQLFIRAVTYVYKFITFYAKATFKGGIDSETEITIYNPLLQSQYITIGKLNGDRYEIITDTMNNTNLYFKASNMVMDCDVNCEGFFAIRESGLMRLVYSANKIKISAWQWEAQHTFNSYYPTTTLTSQSVSDLNQFSTVRFVKAFGDINYLKISDAISTYLTIDNAADTYLSITDASNTYLTINDAASTYGKKASANTWSALNTFTTIPKSTDTTTIPTADTLIRKEYADTRYLTIGNAGAYGAKALANTWSDLNTFTTIPVSTDTTTVPTANTLIRKAYADASYPPMSYLDGIFGGVGTSYTNYNFQPPNSITLGPHSGTGPNFGSINLYAEQINFTKSLQPGGSALQINIENSSFINANYLQITGINNKFSGSLVSTRTSETITTRVAGGATTTGTFSAVVETYPLTDETYVLTISFTSTSGPFTVSTAGFIKIQTTSAKRPTSAQSMLSQSVKAGANSAGQLIIDSAGGITIADLNTSTIPTGVFSMSKQSFLYSVN